MNLLHGVAVFAAGVAAGGINTVVGSGSLITFPTLVALGYPPVVANVSNNIGLVPGNVTGSYGYRSELKGSRALLLRLGVAALIGALIGAGLLLGLPAEAFRYIVPVLIALALVLVVLQPRLSRWMAARREDRHPYGGPWLWLGVLVLSVYGGYFGAAQGIMMLALMAITLDDELQRLNGIKNVLVGLVNGAAAVLFIVVSLVVDSKVNWAVVLLIAVGAALGGVLGARVGRRLPPNALRGLIVLVGMVAIGKLVTG